MYQNNADNSYILTIFSVTTSLILMSCFIVDYMTLFPNVKLIYESESDFNKMVLNYHNVVARGQQFSILPI